LGRPLGALAIICLLMAGCTAEDGEPVGARPTHADPPAPTPVPERNEFLGGEVTFVAASPWDYSVAGWDFLPDGLGIPGPSTMATLVLERNSDERVAVLTDPLPVETGCEEGRAPADAAALAEAIRSDPDLEATEPRAVSVGGVEGLRMDVAAIQGASVCDMEGWPQVMVPPGLDDGSSHFGIEIPFGHRMRLFLLDLPAGSARMLAIAISAPEARFESVVEAAAPILNSMRIEP
jgi:hypothetical protein